MNVFAYTSCDFANEPNGIAANLRKFTSSDAKILFGNMIGDTIHISCKGPASYNSEFRIEFEKMTPDTIWIKPAKKPKLNKNYYLCRAFKGEKVEGIAYKDGSPFYKTISLQDEPFVVLSVLADDAIGRPCIQLKSINENLLVIWHIESKATVNDITQKKQIVATLKEKPICVGSNTTPRVDDVVRTLVSVTFDVSANVLSYTMKATPKVTNNTRLTVVIIDDSYTAKQKALYFYPGGVRSSALYKFLNAEECERYYAEKAAAAEKAAQQELEDIKNDSTFVFPIILGDFVYNEITGTSKDYGYRTCFLYGVAKNKTYGIDYLGYCNGEKIRLHSAEALEYANAEKKAFLQRRGNKGLELREQLAIQSDIEQTEIDNARAIAYVKECENKKVEFAKKQIFLIEQFFAKGEFSRCGLGMNFYNCYNKAIKYIDFTITAYNTFNDPQKDTMEQSQRSGRCVGPIEPKDMGYFLFDEMFWNENGIIKDCKVTSIKITFIDNTTVTFSGWGNVKQHYQEFFFDERNPNYVK